MKTRALIRPAALAHNLAVVRQQAPGLPVIAMVKADAYGHGMNTLLPTLEQHTDALAVARLSEAETLRAAGYSGRLLLLCGVSNTSEVLQALALQLDLLVHESSQLPLFAAQDETTTRTHFWLKLDSGMHRLGIAPQDYGNALAALRLLPWCGEVIAMTHFASADEPTNPKTAEQMACFDRVTTGLPVDAISLANSASLIHWPDARRGWLRPGLMLYGVNPFTGVPLELQAVMQLEASVLAVNTLSAGESTGYNERWRAERESRVAFVACGYADGYPITALNRSYAAVNGQRVPVIGRVSMDTLAIDCTDIMPPSIGDWVELWGDTIPVAEVAAAAGSIPYQLLTAVSARVPRVVT